MRWTAARASASGATATTKPTSCAARMMSGLSWRCEFLIHAGSLFQSGPLRMSESFLRFSGGMAMYWTSPVEG